MHLVKPADTTWQYQLKTRELGKLVALIGKGSQTDVVYSEGCPDRYVCLFGDDGIHIGTAQELAQKEIIRSALDADDIIHNKQTLPSDERFNNNLLQDCKAIINALHIHSLYIDDLQFLLDGNGHLKINDPRTIVMLLRKI